LTDWPGPDSCFVIHTASAGVDGGNAKVPVDISLYQNYPNPFNPSTTIKYYLPKTQRVVLKIYNSLGQEVRTLVDAVQANGYNTELWDGRDDQGLTVSSGIYIYRLSVGDKIKNRKMVFTK
jgi:flagellar hook assembly protein FlgD